MTPKTVKSTKHPGFAVFRYDDNPLPEPLRTLMERGARYTLHVDDNDWTKNIKPAGHVAP